LREQPMVTIEPAGENDLARVVELIDLGAVGRDPSAAAPPVTDQHLAALRAIRSTPGCELYVARLGGETVATFQFAILPNISNGGRPVAQLESLPVAAAWRGRGIGEQLLQFAVARARAAGCFRLQLTSNKARVDPHRFYERFGFTSSHEGMKLTLD